MDTSEVRHPGERIKAEVFPAKMSVTKAAELIGVGRPALSNLLNGKVSSLPIWRLASRRHSDSPGKICSKCRLSTTPSKLNRRASRRTRKRMSPFLAIKANDIESWASYNIVARSRFAVFLRTLVHSTGSGLTEVDFPGNDDSQRAGWDGRIVANEGTAWCRLATRVGSLALTRILRRRRTKITKSVAATDANDRASMEFVFVTPRRWLAKTLGLLKRRKKVPGKTSGPMTPATLSSGWSSLCPAKHGLPTRQDPRRRASARSTSAGQTGQAWRLHRCPARCSVRPSRTRRKLASRLAKGPKIQSWSQRTPPTKRWPLLPSALAPKEVPNWNLIGTRSWFSIKLVSYRNLQAGRGRSFQ